MLLLSRKYWSFAFNINIPSFVETFLIAFFPINCPPQLQSTSRSLLNVWLQAVAYTYHNPYSHMDSCTLRFLALAQPDAFVSLLTRPFQGHVEEDPVDASLFTPNIVYPEVLQN